MKSMTAFAEIVRPLEAGQLRLTLRSVNSKALDLSLRLPPALFPLEAGIRAARYHAGMSAADRAESQRAFIADDAPLEDTDVVLWYTLGAHHIVRPEDWPVMPCAYTGFHLKPIGFFDGNPALDLPPSPPKACHH